MTAAGYLAMQISGGSEMNTLAGYALCAAAGNLAASGFWVAGLALFVAGMALIHAAKPTTFQQENEGE